MNNLLASCQLCPFHCGVNRLAGERGVCRAGALPRVALASLHHWEEPCISGSWARGYLVQPDEPIHASPLSFPLFLISSDSSRLQNMTD